MQDLVQSPIPALPASLAGQRFGTAIFQPYRRAQTTCSDAQFIATLDAFRRSGGLAPAEELLSAHSQGHGLELAVLARWIVARQVIGFAWQARTWLPLFQFNSGDMTPRRDLAPVLAELTEVCDDWELASWFATPHLLLAGRTPADVAVSDVSSVLSAAQASRRAGSLMLS